MDDIWIYIQLGIDHVLDFGAIDHMLFIGALVLPYSLKEWKLLLWWVSLFTLGHTVSLIGNYYFGWNPSPYAIELLIPISIAITCLPLMWDYKKGNVPPLQTLITIAFGLIHGFGFSGYFRMMIPQDSAETALFSFAVGVEIAQLCIVVFVIILNFFILRIFQAKALHWRMIGGAMIFSQALGMILERI